MGRKLPPDLVASGIKEKYVFQKAGIPFRQMHSWDYSGPYHAYDGFPDFRPGYRHGHQQSDLEPGQGAVLKKRQKRDWHFFATSLLYRSNHHERTVRHKKVTEITPEEVARVKEWIDSEEYREKTSPAKQPSSTRPMPVSLWERNGGARL
jgi:hypothetical protein